VLDILSVLWRHIKHAVGYLTLTSLEIESGSKRII